MFGDEPMYGTSIREIDIKGRLLLPAFTNATMGDELILLKIKDYYVIEQKDKIDNYIKLLESRLDNSQSITELEEIRQNITDFCSLIIRELNVDKQGRVNLGTLFNGEKTKVKVIGARKSLIIKTKEHSL